MQQPTTSHICGIDTGSFHVAAILPLDTFEARERWTVEGEILKIENNPLDYAALVQALPPGAPVFLEPTGYYCTAIVAYLQSKGFTLHYVAGSATKDARERWFNLNNKRDDIDARALAVIGFHWLTYGAYPVSTITSTALDLTLSQLTRSNSQAVKETTRAINRIRQLLRATWPEAEPWTENLIGTPGSTNGGPRPCLLATYTPPQIADLTDAQLAANFRRLADRDRIRQSAASTIGAQTPELHATLKQLAAQYTYWLNLSASLQAQITEQVKRHPHYELLSTLPYLGEITAAILCSSIRDIHLYTTKQALRVALGCYPEQKQSGSSINETRHGKKGNRLAKQALHLYALRLVAHQEGQFYRTMQRRQAQHQRHNLANLKQQIVDVIWSMLTHGQPYETR